MLYGKNQRREQPTRRTNTTITNMSRQQNIKQGGYKQGGNIKQGDRSNEKTASLYCKVCHDAGKDDYNKHGLKDKDGKTTCPYLLSLKCNYCKEFGHTQKYCTTGRSANGASITTPLNTREDDKFCGFCYNVDKNDLSYKRHYVRKDKNDPESEVTCPRLKQTECNYCHELGHTPANCDRKKRNSAKKISYEDELKSYDIDKYEIEILGGQKTKEIYEAVKHKTIAEKRFIQIKNVIKEKNDDVAYERDDEEDTKPTIAETTPKKSTWASLASKKKICNAPIPLTRCLTRFGIETKPLEKQTDDVCDSVKTPIIYKKITSWADNNDDDEC